MLFIFVIAFGALIFFVDSLFIDQRYAKALARAQFETLNTHLENHDEEIHEVIDIIEGQSDILTMHRETLEAFGYALGVCLE